ncbi:MAG: class I SAM-dependent methyltransferase [Nitrosomonas sp.]|nr:class I SAM-dependent methyltransferase [Nitrosomonas sp.]
MQQYGSAFARLYNELWNNFSNIYAPVIHNELGEVVDKTLLDLCCGTGNLCVYFLKQGYQVIGLDLSKDMLSYATSKGQSFVTSGRFTTICCNAKNFTLTERFSVATSLYDGINHLNDEEELQSCFKSVFNVLREGGVFIFDLNTTRGLRSWNFDRVRELENAVIIQRGMFIEEKKKAYMEILGFTDTGEGKYERFKEVITNTSFSIQNVKEHLKSAGFTDVSVRKANKELEIAPEPEMEKRVFFKAYKSV